MTEPAWRTRLEANTRRQKLPEPNWRVIWVLSAVIAALVFAGLTADLVFARPRVATPLYIVGGVLAMVVLVFRFYRRLFVWSPPAS